MKDFITYVLSNKKKFQKININRIELNFLENKVIEYFNVKNLTEVRDKFEGSAFLNNFLEKSLPVFALEKFLKISIIEWNNIDISNFPNEINIEGLTFKIVFFKNELPLINEKNSFPIIFFQSNDFKEINICGIADINSLNNYQKNIKNYGIGSKLKKMTSFYGFDKLKIFTSVNEILMITNQ